MNFSNLVDNIHLNMLSNRINAFPIALSDQTQIAAFEFSSLVPGSALHSLVDRTITSVCQEHDAVMVSPVISYTAKDFITKFGLPLPNKIKIDVDGAEEAVIKGFGDFLHSVDSIFVEAPTEDLKYRLKALLSGYDIEKFEDFGDDLIFTRG